MYYFSLLFGFVYWFYVSILPSFTHIIQTRNILSELPKLIIWLQKTSNSIAHAHHLGHFYFIWCFILYIYIFFYFETWQVHKQLLSFSGKEWHEGEYI